MTKIPNTDTCGSIQTGITITGRFKNPTNFDICYLYCINIFFLKFQRKRWLGFHGKRTNKQSVSFHSVFKILFDRFGLSHCSLKMAKNQICYS